jgi:hypothetical protein
MTMCMGLLFVMWCNPSQPVAQIDAARFCVVGRQIRWSRKDTPATIRQIKIHNAAGKAVCSWRRK